MCLFPPAFPTLAYVFSAACLLTTLTRWYHGWTVFAETETPQVLGVGSSTVRVVLIAQKGPGDVFPAGNYSAIVPVLCE